jgi:hypothetical protein
MSRRDEQPTQQIRRPDQGRPEGTADQARAEPPTRPLPAPGPLDLTRERAGAYPDEAEPSEVGWPADEPEGGVAALDAMMAAGEPQPAAPTTMSEAATWTAMPVVPIRSDAPPSEEPPLPRGSQTLARLRADAIAAWDNGREWTREWFGVHDNALGATTGAIAILLILIVALLGH